MRVRNLSITGALVDGQELPGEGARVELRRGSLVASGELAWASGDQRGIRFDRSIEVSSWVKPIGHPGQRRVDLAVDSLRLRIPKGSHEAEPKDVIAEAETLEVLGRQIQAIAEQLALSPDITVEMEEQLLKLDAIGSVLLRFGKP